MKLYLIRHGESIGNTKKGFISGRSDPDGLSKKGRIQIIRTAWELRHETFDRIFVSPVHRARETASLVNLYHNAFSENIHWLTELDHGLFEGNYWWDVMDKIPPGWKKLREDYATAYPGGGESMKDLVERVWDGYQSLLQNYSEDSNIVCVSHQAVITALMYCIEYGSPYEIKTEEQKKHFLHYMHNTVPSNGSITRVILKHKQLVSLEMQKQFDQVEVTDETVKFYMQGLIGDITIPQIDTLQTSSGNSVYKIKFEPKRFILKIYKDHELMSIERLVKLYQYLEKNTAIEAPLILHYEKSRIFFQEAVVLQDYKKGNEQGECFNTCPNGIESILKQTYDILKHIQLIPITDVKDFWFTDDWDDKSHPTFAEYFKKEIRWTMDKLQQLPEVCDSVKNGIKQDLQKLYQYIKEESYRVVPLHGDLSPHNFVVHHDKMCQITRILDFERARLGDKLWDFAYYYGWIQRSGEDISETWKQLVYNDLNEEEKKIFILYWTLFHAWTIRDMKDYVGNSTRERRGKKSLELLTQYYLDSQ